MKKLFLLIIPLLFIFSPRVFADTYSFDIDYVVTDLSPYTSGSDLGSYTQVQSWYNDNSSSLVNAFNQFYSTWETNYKDDYPYYTVSIDAFSTSFQLDFYFHTSIPSISSQTTTSYLLFNGNGTCIYNISTETFSSSCGSLSLNDSSRYLYEANNSSGSFYSSSYFYSNYDLYFDSVNTTNNGFSSFYTPGSRPDTYIQRQWSVPSSAPIITGYSFLDLDFLTDYDIDTYTEVDLNDYSYLVLSLKDYNHLISPVEFEILGQVCITPVYDYGQKEKPNGVTDRCSLEYQTYTPMRYYIKQDDLTNKAVFYVSPYNVSITNKIKINTRVFNISYITSNNADEPVAIIGGREYPVKPYSSLTSSSQINEDNGYIPGESQNVFDISSNSNFITDLFSNPLQALGNVWGSIISMFSLVGSFISLLPSVLQTFLISAFSIAIVLGIIKILI